jgi:hypothetical protein
MSQSEIEITMSFVGTGAVVKGTLLRLDAPFTVQKLMDKSPFTVRSRGNIGSPKTFWMFFVDIKKGAERNEYKGAKPGDIVYCPLQDALFVVFGENPKINLPVFYLGQVTEGLESFSSLRNGTMVKMQIKPL